MLLRVQGLDRAGQMVSHQARIMAAAGALLKDSIRSADTVRRYRGRGVPLALPATTTVAALKLSPKLGARIEAYDSHADSPVFDAPFGMVEWGRGDDVAILLARGRIALDRTVESCG